MDVPMFLVGSGEDEGKATNARNRKYEESRLISDLTGFDNLRAMMEAENFMRKKRRERRERKKMKKKHTERKAEENVIMTNEKPLILITSSEDEDASKLKKRKYEDECRVIADLTGFDNLRAMMEAENLRTRKSKKKKKKGRNALSYAQEKPSENKKAERSGEILLGNMQQERENPTILISSTEEEDANDMKKRKFENKDGVNLDLTGSDNLRSTCEEEALLRSKKRKRLRNGKEKILCDVQEEVLVNAMEDVGQSSRVQAAETAEALEAASTKVNMVREEKQPAKNQGLESAFLSEKESVGRNYKIMPWRPLWRPRYFDPPDNCWRLGSSHREECNTIVRHQPQWQKRPCFICARFDHTWRACKQGQSFVWKAKSHTAKDCLAKQHEDNESSNICLRCGGSGHSMFSCRNAYAPDDLKKIQCYLCKSFGHLCCVNSQDESPRQPSCYRCGRSGHIGSVSHNHLLLYSIIIVNRASSESYQGSSIKECVKFRGVNELALATGVDRSRKRYFA